MSLTPEAALQRALDGFRADLPEGPIGVAVSGGGDSVALLHLAQAWCAARGVGLRAATVDHGLRAASAEEAAGVARLCAGLGVPHRVLRWQGRGAPRDGGRQDGGRQEGERQEGGGQGNLQDAARRARRGLLAGWAQAEGLSVVLLGHTADDQAETVLMRLARGSGVDGLCGMEAVDGSGRFLRPLLEVRRAALRDWLVARGIGWIDDPSNDDLRFDRIRARHLLAGLADLGLTADRLTETAGHMRRARATLWQAAADWTGAHLRAEAGDLLLDAAALDLAAGDTPGRVLAAAVQWIGGAVYRPRYRALLDLSEGLRRGETRTLGGVLALPAPEGGARLTREPSAVQAPVAVERPEGVLWDGRWCVAPPPGAGRPASGLTVAALGAAGLAACPDWRASGLPRAALLASPAVWQGARLVAAPITGLSNGWQAGLRLSFDRFIVSH